MKVIEYKKLASSAFCVTDRVKLEVPPEDFDSLKAALVTMSLFESAVLSAFKDVRGFSASDTRNSDTFKEIHFWFKDGFVMATIRSGSIG
jgi:hypothetical protein